MNEFLPTVESALANAWGGTVKLALQGMLERRTHVARLDVVVSPPGMPKTVIVKRWRRVGDVGFDPHSFASNLLNDWASLEFMAHRFGNGSLAPQFYVGDAVKGFIVIEDLLDGATLDTVLHGNDAAQAAQAFRRYGETLGNLHAQTLGQSAPFIALRRTLGPLELPEPNDYLSFFHTSLEALEALAITVPPTAYRDLHQAADHLSQLAVFSALHHGDPAPGNAWINTTGGLYLFDFESAHFDHALLEGVHPRMGFPTCGLAFVSRVPEPIWRQAEAAYRAVLIQHCPEAADAAIYGARITAACAWWALAFCQKWLVTAIGSELPEQKLNRVRQCAIARFEAFVQATKEFNSLSALGETFAKLVGDLRARWPQEAQELPLYPVFQAGNSRNVC